MKSTDSGKERTAEVVLTPDPSHCVETAARNAYRRGIDQYFRLDDPDPELEARLETLQKFLEQADFRRLRRETESFVTGGKTVRFFVALHGERIRWRVEADTAEEVGR